MKTVGKIKKNVIDSLNIKVEIDTPIYIGDSNIRHMKNKHLDVYDKYKDNIEEIIESPNYVGINKTDNSIEYVKEYKSEQEYVKIAVRVSCSQKYYVRTMYILNNKRVVNFINKGCLKKLDQIDK